MDWTIEILYAPRVTAKFLETLAALSVVDLSVEEAKKVFLERLRSGILTVVAIQNNDVIGTASMFYERKFLHKGGLAGHIEDVAVHPDHQKNGVGKSLILYLLERAKERGCYKVVLDCKPPLGAFYERCGFEEVGYQLRYDVPKI